jgi:hypothetical protein
MSPTVTVTVAALVTVGQKARNGPIIITTAAMRSKEVFIILIISTVELKRSVAAGNTGKVTRLLLSRSVEARDQCAVLCAAKPSISDLPVFEETSGVYYGSRIV